MTVGHFSGTFMHLEPRWLHKSTKKTGKEFFFYVPWAAVASQEHQRQTGWPQPPHTGAYMYVYITICMCILHTNTHRQGLPPHAGAYMNVYITHTRGGGRAPARAHTHTHIYTYIHTQTHTTKPKCIPTQTHTISERYQNCTEGWGTHRSTRAWTAPWCAHQRTLVWTGVSLQVNPKKTLAISEISTL